MYNRYLIVCLMLMCIPMAYGADQALAGTSATGAVAQSAPGTSNLTMINLTEFTEKNPLNPANGSVTSRLALGKNISLHLAQLAPGTKIPMHYHGGLEEVIMIEGGLGIISMSGMNYSVKAGDILYLPASTPSAVYALGDENLLIISVFSPPSDGTRIYT